MVIDPHTHIVPSGFLEDVRNKAFGDTVTVQNADGKEWIVTKSNVLGKSRELRNILTPMYYEVDLRLKDMKRMGVSRQILSVSPSLTFYSLDKSITHDLAQSMNDALIQITKDNPSDFSCMATVPLQDSELAAVELERAVKNGHLGVQIASNVAGQNLDDPELDVFWQKAQDLGITIFIHPIDTMGAADRLKDFYLRNFIGNPLDTTIAAACLIFGGVLDRFPNLNFFLSHLGGFLPWIRGRWEHGYGERREPKVHGSKNPEEYINRFFYDTIIHNADSFEFAVKTLGAERVLYGTDYPADMANHQNCREIPGMSRLEEKQQNQILIENVRKLYQIT